MHFTMALSGFVAKLSSNANDHPLDLKLKMELAIASECSKTLVWGGGLSINIYTCKYIYIYISIKPTKVG